MPDTLYTLDNFKYLTKNEKGMNYKITHYELHLEEDERVEIHRLKAGVNINKLREYFDARFEEHFKDDANFSYYLYEVREFENGLHHLKRLFGWER